MRVITGTAKGIQLLEVPGDSTRPIRDMVKEALFSILGDWIIDTHTLDLFGGTGSIGIEALSRGGAEAVFVEQAAPAQRTIQENLKRTHLADRARLVKGDAFKFLEGEHQKPYDIIYIAPPQYKSMWLKALTLIDERPDLLTEDGVVIVQIHPKEFEEVTLTNLVQYDERKYGSTLLCFYELDSEDGS